MSDESSATTLAEMAELATRQAQALAEAGRPDLAEHSHIIVTQDGQMLLSTSPIVTEGKVDPDRLKAMAIDPLFQVHPDWTATP